jgi:hypothetical protein
VAFDAGPSTGSFKSLTGIVSVEVVVYALYAVWLEFNDEVRCLKDATDPESPDPTAALCELHRRNGEFASPSEVRTMDAFNGLLARAIYMLPHHVQAISDDVAFDHGIDDKKLGPLLREQNLKPRLVVDYSNLTPDQTELYRDFWARGETIATVVGGSLGVKLRDMDRLSLFDFLHRWRGRPVLTNSASRVLTWGAAFVRCRAGFCGLWYTYIIVEL